MNVRTVLPAFLACAALLAPLATSAQPYTGNAEISRSGVIVSVQGDRFALSNGATVYLHPGVSIDPGVNLRPGMRVWITGTVDDDGVLNADAVSLRPPDSNRSSGYDPNARYFPNGWYDGNGFFHRYH